MDDLRDVRAADADRERVVDVLRLAHGDGRLTLDEFDERAGAAWAARTYGELAVVTMDLPQQVQPVQPVQRPTAPSAPSTRVDRGAVRTWLRVSLINVLIWAVVSVAVGAAVYPWFVWVAGPWGAMLLIRHFAESRSAHTRRGQAPEAIGV